MTPSGILRRRTAEAHTELENMRFGRRLAAGEIDRTRYSDYLRATATVVASLRTEVRRHRVDRQGVGALRPFLETFDDWTRLLEQDITHLGGDDGMANAAAQRAALDLVQTIRRHLVDAPGWVLGTAYVLFGSHNGNRAVAKAVASGLGLQGRAGTAYLRATCGDKSLWPAFKDHVDRALDSERLVDEAVRGALATFACFAGVFESLDRGGARVPHASAINPEAGDHPVAADSAFRDIAVRAGTRCHTAFGYLVRRYGDRGEAFARSDGAWVGTLVELPEDAARDQVDWLARLLSARGIPSVCLEHHFDVLCEEMTEHDVLTPDARNRFKGFAQNLRARSRPAIDPESYRRLTNTDLPPLDPRGAETLVSAVADQHLALAQCADRVTDWIENAGQIDATDRRELIRFLEAARAATTT